MCIDFKQHKIIPTEYTIRTMINCEPNYVNLKGWIIEVSNDGCYWELIDEQHNCSSLNGPGLIHTFKIRNLNESVNKFFKLVKFILYGY